MKLGSLLKKVGLFIIIFGIFGGMLLADSDLFPRDSTWTVIITTSIISFIEGLLFIGIGKVIDLLEEQNDSIRNNDRNNRLLLDGVRQIQEKISSNTSETSTRRNMSSLAQSAASTENTYFISEEQKLKIIRLYPRKIKVKNITNTPFDNIYLVACADGKYDLIHYLGYAPVLINPQENEEIDEWLNAHLLTLV